MNNNEIQQAKDELSSIQEEIGACKRALSDLNQKKERWFSKRAEIGKKIAERIREVKERREKRDALTEAVQKKKKERREFSQEIRDKIAEVKRLRNERQKRLDELGVKGKPSKGLQKEIQQLEFKLETTPMKYSEEKKLTKILKEKKAAAERFKEVSGLNKQIRTLSKEIDELKTESDEVHENLQDKAEDSQVFHEDVIETSKEIDELKAEEDAAYAKFSEFKDQYLVKKDELQELLNKADALVGKLGDVGEMPEQIDRRAVKKLLQEKGAEVEEKVKKKEKLTTEDLLAFQGAN